LESFRFVHDLDNTRVLLFIRPGTDVQKNNLGVARDDLSGSMDCAGVAIRTVERNQNAKRFRLYLLGLTQNLHGRERTAGGIMERRAAGVCKMLDTFGGKSDP